LLAGGAGGAIAATTSESGMAPTPLTTISRSAGGWNGYGYGWGSGVNGWRGPATGVGWGAWGVGSKIGGAGCRSLVRSGRRAAETYLGLGASQLDSRLQSGKTLAEIVSGQGQSVGGLEHAIEAAVGDSVNTDSTLSASQKSSIIANLRSFVDSAVTGTWHGAVGLRYAGPTTGGGW
jgi:hypothetical protein